MRPKNKSKPLYIVGGVFYYTRTSLIFYNDETEAILDIVVKDARPTKPKRESNDTHDQYEARLAKWDAKEAKMVDIKVRGNAMTQYYYTRKILPHYVTEFESIKAKLGCATLQEDGDPSYGSKST